VSKNVTVTKRVANFLENMYVFAKIGEGQDKIVRRKVR